MTNQFGAGNFNDGRIYFAGIRRQKGAGLGGIFGAVGRHLLPFIKKFILPRAASAVASVASDFASRKQPLSESIKEHGKHALKRAGTDILNQSGSGKRRKRKTARKQIGFGKTKRRKSVKRNTKKTKKVIGRPIPVLVNQDA